MLAGLVESAKVQRFSIRSGYRVNTELLQRAFSHWFKNIHNRWNVFLLLHGIDSNVSQEPSSQTCMSFHWMASPDASDSRWLTAKPRQLTAPLCIGDTSHHHHNTSVPQQIYRHWSQKICLDLTTTWIFGEFLKMIPAEGLFEAGCVVT